MSRMTAMQKKENREGWLFMIPAMIFFISLIIFPVVMSLVLAFTKWNFLTGISGIKWIGVQNFIKIITRD